MGGCQNYGPFLGTLHIRCRIIIGIQKRDHNFDNHPHPTGKAACLGAARSVARAPELRAMIPEEGLRAQGRSSWVAVKELKLSYHNGYI